MIASEYGYTIEQFLALTIRQLQIFILKIHKRQHNRFVKEANLHASIHGLKIEMPFIGVDGVTEQSSVDFNEQEQELADQVMKRAIQGKLAEYGN